MLLDVAGCFEPSQVACLLLSAKGNRQDRVMPVRLGHDQLTKSDCWCGISRMI
jgi:hypothetical protein